MAGDEQVRGSLSRSMSASGVLFLTLSAATPASSLFIIVPDILREAGSGALTAMLAAGGVAVLIAIVYASLASAFPLAGGEYAITARILGPAAGFAVLGMNFANSVLGAAVLALGLSDYLQPLGPLPPPPVLAAGTLLVCGGLGALSVRTNATLTGAFLLLELAAVGLIAVLGFAHPERPLLPLAFHTVELRHGRLVPAGLLSVGVAATVALFAYDGYGSAVYFGEELIRPRRWMGPTILTALILVLLAEISPLTGVLAGAPDLSAVLADPSPFLSFARMRGGAGLEAILGLSVALAILNAVLAMVLLTARQLYAVARDGLVPRRVAAPLLELHPRFRSPALASMMAGMAAAALAFIPIRLLLIMTGAGVALVYLSLCLAVLAWKGAPGGVRLGLRLAAAAGALALALVLLVDLQDPDEGRPGLIATVAFAGLGVGYGRLMARRGRGFALRGPPLRDPS